MRTTDDYEAINEKDKSQRNCLVFAGMTAIAATGFLAVIKVMNENEGELENATALLSED